MLHFSLVLRISSTCFLQPLHLLLGLIILSQLVVYLIIALILVLSVFSSLSDSLKVLFHSACIFYPTLLSHPLSLMLLKLCNIPSFVNGRRFLLLFVLLLFIHFIPLVSLALLSFFLLLSFLPPLPLNFPTIVIGF